MLIFIPQSIGHIWYFLRRLIIPDDREGWVESLKRLLQSYFFGTPSVDFNRKWLFNKKTNFFIVSIMFC